MAKRLPEVNGTQSTVTPPSEWRRQSQEGVLIRLISGNVARIRPVNTDTFLKAGHIPNSLIPVVEDLFINGSSAPQRKTVDDYLAQDVAILDAFIKTCFVEPRVVDEVTDPDREITPADVSDADKNDLMSYLGRPASELARFHPLEAEPVDRLDGESEQPPVAEPTAEHS